MKTLLRSRRGQTLAIELRSLGDDLFELDWQGRAVPVRVLERSGTRLVFEIDGAVHSVHTLTTAREVRIVHAGRETLLARESSRGDGEGAAGSGEPVLRAIVPGRVLRVAVTEGARVRSGDLLIVIEAMKMENPFHAEADGVVAAVHVAEGEMVTHGQDLVTCRYEPV